MSYARKYKHDTFVANITAPSAPTSPFELVVNAPAASQSAYFQRIDGFIRFWKRLTRSELTRAQATEHLRLWDRDQSMPNFRHYEVTLVQVPQEPPQVAKDALVDLRLRLTRDLPQAFVSDIGDSIFYHNEVIPENKPRAVQRFDVSALEDKKYKVYETDSVQEIIIRAAEEIFKPLGE